MSKEGDRAIAALVRVALLADELSELETLLPELLAWLAAEVAVLLA